MGTRAQFFVGDPLDIENRQWLGAVAWDGYPDGDIGDHLEGVTTEDGFRLAISLISSERRDFCDPSAHSFPFPWTDDLFLTDCTYAWFGDRVQFTYFHRGFVDLDQYRMSADFREEYGDREDQLAGDIPAPVDASEKPAGPDSAIILSVA